MPASPAIEEQEDWQLFCQNIDLLLNNEKKILNVANYFFCQPSFMYCSFPYIQGDGRLPLGYLLLSWQNRLLVQPCPDSHCGDMTLITSFSGSPLSGSNYWSGYCTNCRSRKSGSRTDIPFYEVVIFVSKLRQTFPAVVKEIEEYNGHQFCWGGTGLEPVIKKRIVSKAVGDSVTLAVLIQELKAGQIRQGKPVNVRLLKRDFALKLSGSLRTGSVNFRV